MKYFKNRKYIIRRTKFTYRDALFDGHGFLEWDAGKGFKLKLFVESEEYKRPKVQSFGAPSVIKKSDRQNIHLYFSDSINEFGIKQAIVPDVFLGQRFDISTTDTLSFSTPHLIFFKENFKKESGYYSGNCIYRLKQVSHLPETIHLQEKIGDEDFREGWKRKGIQYRSENEYLIGWLEDDEYLHLKFGFNKDKYTQNFALNFPCGFRYAISFLLGMEVKRLKSELNGKNTNVEVIKKSTEINELPTYRGLQSFQFFNSETLWDLAIFFTKGYVNKEKHKESYVARNMFEQLIEAEQQKSLTAQELLTATILEASLRTLYDIPFQNNSNGNFYVPDYLKNNFIRDYADGKKWREVRKTVIKAFDRMRHRNAHPDWLLGLNVYDDDHISDTFHDLRKMIKFYQQIILLMAEIKDVEPELVEKI